jgi:hypothetical protein
MPSSDDETFTDALEILVDSIRRRIESIEHAHIRLSGRVDALLAMLSTKTVISQSGELHTEAEIVDLPKGFWRRDRVA